MSTNDQNQVGGEQVPGADALSTDQAGEVGGGTEHNGTYTFFHDVAYGVTTMYNGAVSATTDALCWLNGVE